MKKEGAVPYPNTLAAELLQREIVSLNPDGFHYTRMIQGEPHEKIIFGSIK